MPRQRSQREEEGNNKPSSKNNRLSRKNNQAPSKNNKPSSKNNKESLVVPGGARKVLKGVGVHTPQNVHACIHLVSVGNTSKTKAKNKKTKQ